MDDLRFSSFDFRWRDRQRCRAAALWIVAWCGFTSFARAEDAVTLTPVERWSSVFAESESRWTYRLSAERAFQARVAWRLTANQRTLASGELDARGDADKPAQVTIPLRWPNVKPGVVLPVQLTLSVGDVRHERLVWIFPRDPFADRHEWLQSLKLTVFDPPGDTVSLLEDNKIPHERVRTREGMEDLTEGVVIIGEGVSLKDHEGLIDDLRALAARGVSVLCLASADGAFAFPGDKPQATSLQLRRADVIRELDKRLDAAWWPKGSSQQRGLRITSSDDDVLAEVSDAENSWPWAEWQFETSAAKSVRPRCVWCGFGLVSAWDDSPTPRFLFVKLLERLSTSSQSQEN